MKPCWQAVLLTLSLMGIASAEPASGRRFSWTPPVIGKGLFTENLGMLEREREDYAGNLAAEATNRVILGKASAASLAEARRLLALALHLAPRNRKALVLNYQLNRGVLPENRPDGYDPEVLARLLFTRAELLRQQGGEENQLLSRVFVEVSAEMDPKNEDAVYASEIQRLDHGAVDWSTITDGKLAKVIESRVEPTPEMP